MNRRSLARADPRGHFPRVCFDSKFPVKLVTRTGSLFDPTNSLLSPCGFSAPFDARSYLETNEISRA